jgi:hypothetical protein
MRRFGKIAPIARWDRLWVVVVWFFKEVNFGAAEQAADYFAPRSAVWNSCRPPSRDGLSARLRRAGSPGHYSEALGIDACRRSEGRARSQRMKRRGSQHRVNDESTARKKKCYGLQDRGRGTTDWRVAWWRSVLGLRREEPGNIVAQNAAFWEDRAH